MAGSPSVPAPLPLSTPARSRNQQENGGAWTGRDHKSVPVPDAQRRPPERLDYWCFRP